jgi:hypothetical protein
MAKKTGTVREAVRTPAPEQIWRNRIVGHGEVDGKDLVANPRNWRIHPDNQRTAMVGVLDEVGWVQQVIVNKRTGCVVDGHLRAELAIAAGQIVPVVYVDLDEDEEAKILASMDPLSSMAITDSAALTALLAGMETENGTLDALLHSMVDMADATGLSDVAESDAKDPLTGRLLGGDKKAQIKAVLYAKQISIFETALKATGEMNRGEALMKICRAYLEVSEKRQHDVPVKAQPAEASTARA